MSTGFASWQRYCTASSSEFQPNFEALNRGRHLCSAGRPSRWALAHILDLNLILPTWRISHIENCRCSMFKVQFDRGQQHQWRSYERHLPQGAKRQGAPAADGNHFLVYSWTSKDRKKFRELECGPMPNVMAALPNIGGALCSTPQSLADAHY